jgi:amino acid adenylation domain-containing protein
LFAPRHLCQYLEESAARFPERIAAVDRDGTTLTYLEVDRQAGQMAGYLVSRGVQPGDRVGIVLPKSTAALIALFAIMKARAAYVPVDWSGPVERIRSILTDCQVSAVFLDRRRLDLAGVAGTLILCGPDSECPPLSSSDSAVDWNYAVKHEQIRSDPAARQSGDLAYILYTSGSTGVPKGVMLTHRNATSFVDWCSDTFAPTEDDRFSSHAPFHFDLSILDIYVAIKHGASVHLIPDDLGKSPQDLAHFIASRRLTVWYSTPAILALLAEFRGLDQLDFSSLRQVLFAGEVFPVKQLRRLVSRWPLAAYYNLYGPTETNVCTFAGIPTPIPAERTDPYPIGRLCSHCDGLVLDSDGHVVDGTDEGLLYISGPPVFSGYWGRPVETAAAFIEHGGIRWYNTGDVVKWSADEGYLYVGRRDRMVKRRGYRIELGEVESCLYRHSAVRAAAVIALPHPESGMRIIAYIAAPEDTHPSVIEMKTFCNGQLPAYMNPDIFLFVPEIPKTSTNKTDYQALIAGFQTPVKGEPG